MARSREYARNSARRHIVAARHVLGVYPLGSGNNAVEVRPQVEEPMQRVSGTMHIGASTLDVEWSLNGAGYFSLVVEQHVEGELHLVVPRFGKRFPTIALNGETVWRNEKIYPNFHTREVISEPHTVYLSCIRWVAITPNCLLEEHSHMSANPLHRVILQGSAAQRESPVLRCCTDTGATKIW